MQKKNNTFFWKPWDASEKKTYGDPFLFGEKNVLAVKKMFFLSASFQMLAFVILISTTRG